MIPQPITPNNKLPDEYQYEDIYSIMRQRGHWRVKCGNNTYAATMMVAGQERPDIRIILYDNTVAVLHPDGNVTLMSNRIFTDTTADRMERAVIPLGYEVDLEGNRYWLYHDDRPIASFRDSLRVPPPID